MMSPGGPGGPPSPLQFQNAPPPPGAYPPGYGPSLPPPPHHFMQHGQNGGGGLPQHPPQGPPPPPPHFHQQGVFTPDMIMQAQRQQQQQQQQQQQYPNTMMMQQPPQPPQQQMNNTMNTNFPPPALGAGPPRAPPGFRPPPPPSTTSGTGGGGAAPPHPHANLSQRLRALNLAEHVQHQMPRGGAAMRRRHQGSQCMAHDEIESILHMQWRPLHQGPPYIEDYYYQAFVFKYYGKRNRRSFAPESVRELAPTEKMTPDEISFVKLEGLGRVPFSNVRRPRPLMDVTPEDLRAAAAAAAAVEGGGGGVNDDGTAAAAAVAPTSTRRLNQEPMLAARIMIEDCMALILDVQDIDRIYTAAASTGGRIENEVALRQRRSLLMNGLTASLRLPDGALLGDAEQQASGGGSDGVFLRLLALPKGQNLAARALQQLYPPAEAAPPPPPSAKSGEPAGTAAASEEPNLRILWAILRNVRALFGGGATKATTTSSKSGAVADAQNAASRVARTAADVIKRLHSPASVCAALSALVHGDLDATRSCTAAAAGGGGDGMDDPEAVLLPLFPPGVESAAQHQFPWLVDILAALLQRGAEFELSSGSSASGGDEAEVSEWKKDFTALYSAVLQHIEALAEVAGAAAAEGDAEVAAEVQKLIPVELARSLLQHCSKERGDAVKKALTAVGM